MQAELDALRAEVATLRDKDAITTLQTAYGYYVDKAQWDEAADLFARGATLENGTVFNHMQLQPLITVDGDAAKGRWRAIMEVGFAGRESLCGEGTYENEYVREDGVWKIAKLHFFVTYYVAWDKGWSDGGVPMGTPLPGMAPDAFKTVDYDSFPAVYIPPYHYPNPVTGKEWKR
jgi:SnoaL-like domain